MASPSLSDLLDAAIQYGRRGLAVFPGHSITDTGQCTCANADCGHPGKHPRIKDWQNMASTDEATIRQWWRRWPDANVCIVTGRTSGIVVLDIDPRHGGFESLEALKQQHGDLPRSLSVRTGGGGIHFYFAHPGQLLKNKVNLLPGIDFRGDGGFVVAPPSRHESGQEYSWQ